MHLRYRPPPTSGWHGLRIVSPKLPEIMTGGREGGARVFGYNSAVMRRVAVLTLVAFGCATVRVPVTSSGEPVDSAGTIAPPITELWLESSESVPRAVADAADAKAREALAAALAGREIPTNAAGAEDAVLFVRKRAVGLTEERRSQQTWAKVGVVAGIVVVVAAAVMLAVKGGKGSSPQAKAVKPKASAVGVKPRVTVPAAVRPAAVAHAAPVPRYYPYHSGPSFFFGFSFNFYVAPRPLVLAPE